MHKSVRMALVGALMLACFALATARALLAPPLLLSSSIDLGAMLPERFADWKTLPLDASRVVNPQQDELSARIYTQTLTRLYRNQVDGQQIMLVIAYGADQRDDLQVHYPEVCYPGQGFEVLSNHKLQLATGFGALPVRRMETRLGQSRFEPVTYWAMLGDQVVLDGLQKKLTEMRMAWAGQRSDGLLFRVSSIDPQAAHGFASQTRFITDLLDTLPAADRHRLSGL
ncbi:MAG: EpsI family protein [Rhodoferax sp.]|nr:EpsI family protein [Rhodoferax sp.]